MTNTSKRFDCDHPGLMPVEDALARMLKEVSPKAGSINLPLLKADKRIVYQDIFSSVNVPPAANSAMDGYAFNHADLVTRQVLTLVGTSLAGTPFAGRLKPGECVRIMTGAVIPDGADTVIMQEQVEVDNGHVRLLKMPDVGNSVRKAGEDIQAGDVVINKGCRLTPAHLSLLASIGEANVNVATAPKVALMTTGDELKAPGSQLKAGEIYESNRYALFTLLERAGADVVDLGVIPDNKAALRNAFNQAEHCDLIISSGGVSVGDADYVKDILAEKGQVGFWKVAIKPGKPFAFGRIGQALFCGLPGNPVSSYVTFQTLVTPLLAKLMGEERPPTPTFAAIAEQTIRKRPGRADYQRGVYFYDAQGQLKVSALPNQGSGVMSSITRANCYLILEQDGGDIAAGQSVNIQLL